jgi:hypothetical protein
MNKSAAIERRFCCLRSGPPPEREFTVRLLTVHSKLRPGDFALCLTDGRE